MSSDVRGTVLSALLVLVAISLVVGQLAGQPVLLGFVTSDSMEPTLSAGDGFIAVPQSFGEEPEQGDVVVFEAEDLHDGGLTTHRIVDETADGYVTKGDVNPFTDQDGGEPPVSEDRIVASALQVGGSVVTIPHLGTVVVTVRGAITVVAGVLGSLLGTQALASAQGVGFLLVLVGLGLFVRSLVDGGRMRDRERRPVRNNGISTPIVLVVLLLVVLIPANAVMVLPSGTDTISLDGGEAAAAGMTGETVSDDVVVTNDGLVTMYVVVSVEQEGADVTPTELGVPQGTERTATLTVPAPPPDEHREVGVTHHRYLLLLPPSVLSWLHATSPFLAWGVLNVLLVMSVVGLTVGALGTGRMRNRTRDRGRSVPGFVRMQRFFR